MERGQVVRFRSSDSDERTHAHFPSTYFFKHDCRSSLRLNGGGQVVRAPIKK